MFVSGWLAAILLSTAAWSEAPPNFVLIMADDLGYGDLGCYGGEIPTPELDRLAADGLRMTDFHSSGNVCSPTRAGLMTGRYQQRVGVPGVINADPALDVHHTGLPREEVTFAEALGSLGYETAVLGKWHLGYSKEFNPVHHGFTRFRGFVSGNIDYQSHYDRMESYDWWDGLELVREPGYTTRLITDHAVEFIRQQRARNFCLYVAHEAVHAPWQGPNDAAQRGPEKATNQSLPDRKRAFREMLTELDASVGRIREAIERHHLGERTVMFFCSDNGPAGGSAGPLRGRKGSNWEGGHRVPGIAWWPGKIKPGSETDQLAITLDLMPTFLELAQAAVPDNLDGKSLVQLWLKGRQLGRRQLFWNGKAMRDGSWKLVRAGRNDSDVGLYNLTEDLGESHNVLAQHPDRARSMQEALDAWSADVQRNTAPH